MNPTLRAESDWWTEVAPRFGFGRVQVAPIYSTAEGVLKYLLRQGPDACDISLGDVKNVRFWYRSRDLKTGTTKFAWNSLHGRQNRERLKGWAAERGCMSYEELTPKLGSRWGYEFFNDISRIMEGFPDRNSPGKAALAAAAWAGSDEAVRPERPTRGAEGRCCEADGGGLRRDSAFAIKAAEQPTQAIRARQICRAFSCADPTHKQPERTNTMAVILQMTYSKKLGLPNFSSHSCSVSIQSEIPDLSQVTGEVKRLYALTQDAVDREIQAVGYMPDATTYGMLPAGNGSNESRESRNKADTAWACSSKQRELIEKIVRENELDRREVDELAKEMFNGAGVRQLNRLQASGLIDELLERHGGQRRSGNSNGYRGRFQREPRSTR